MKCITEIKKIVFDLKVEIEDELKAEKYAGGFDDSWIQEMQIRQDILDTLNKIVATYEFVVEQDNK